MSLRLFAGLLAVVGALTWFLLRPIDHPDGILAPEPPRQTLLDVRDAMHKSGYLVTPVADFALEARVLSKKHYRSDALAGVAPYDLALGWGPMSDSAVLDAISISQMQRFYMWRTSNYPIPRNDIIRHSSNMHMIPATPAVESALSGLKAGHVIAVRGRLVDVVTPEGEVWATSKSRTDAGMGACEIVLAESVEILAP